MDGVGAGVSIMADVKVLGEGKVRTLDSRSSEVLSVMERGMGTGAIVEGDGTLG